MTDTTFKNTITVKTLGNPKYLLGQYEMKDGDRRKLGTIVGAATGKIKREIQNKPGEYYHGISGKFEAINTDDDGEIIRVVKGKNLFAPDLIHDSVCAKLDEAGPTGTVKFGFEAYVVCGGTAGFTWEYKFLGEAEPEANDVLSDVRKLVTGNIVPKLEAPKKRGRVA